MRNKLIIMGSGGFAAEAFSWIDGYEVIGFFSESDPRDAMFDLPILKTLDSLAGYSFILAVGDPLLKERFWDKAVEKGLEPCDPIIHHTAVIGRQVYLDKGALLCPQSVITTRTNVGCGLILNLAVTVGHDCSIGDFVTVSPGANISGNVTIGDSAYIGTNACIRERLIIGDTAVIGMGSVVLKNVPSGSVVIGNPARQLEQKPLT